MEKLLPLARQLSRARWLPPLVILLTLAILGTTIVLGTLELRDSIRRQIVNRDGEVLDAVATLEQIGAESPEALTRHLEDTAGQLTLALRLSKLSEGVLATRLFDAQGRFVTALPASVREATLPADAQIALQGLRPVSRYEAHARLDDYFLLPRDPALGDSAPLPLVSVLIPLHAPGQTNLLAVAELIQDGHAIAGEFAALDRNLWRQAFIAFLASGGIVVLALAWAFRRLQGINRQLHAQAVSLRRANQELALTAKTSALGAVTAHVVHGLTSPLTGLQNFVSARAADDAEWQDALRDTQRMQSLIGEIVRVLGEAADDTRYELPLAELGQIISAKATAAAQHAGVRFESRLAAEGLLSNRDANLVLLILENLLNNAIQATPPGRTVRLSVEPREDNVVCEVADEGPGLPDNVRQQLFTPCHSSKAGGNGIGLALSRHLARHLGAELELIRSSEAGCAFSLTLPAKLFLDGNKAAALQTAGEVAGQD